MTCAFQADPLGRYLVNPQVDFRNPKQGIFKDCHLIAALSTLGWINPTYFPGLGEKSTYGYSFFDYDPSKDQYPPGADLSVVPVQVKVNVNSTIYLDDQTGLYCGARSNNWTGSVHETWPSLYEKAWAKFCLWKFKNALTYTLREDANTNPAFSGLPDGSSWGGNPVTVMRYLSGLKCEMYHPVDASFTYSTSSATDCYLFIRNVICDSAAGIGKKITTPFSGTVNGAKTKFATAAWTYPSSSAANAPALKPKKQLTTDVVYSPDSNLNFTIAADHCYSVLGVIETPGGKYIVLRNPWGVDPTSTTLPVETRSWIYNNRTYNSKGDPLSGTFNSLDLSALDGVFALSAAYFHDYFAGFGFVHS